MSQVVATTSENEDEESFIDFLECYLSGNEVTGATPSEKVMRDNVIGLTLGAEGTTGITLSWFFWLLSKNNPLIEAKIREEITENLPCQPMKFTLEDLSKLVYLHAALCETLRLFPPVPFQLRKNEETDTLPSGHEIKMNTDVLISMYAIGRMRSVWGEDCYEFKPERWISEDGKIKHVPPQKFFAFNAGPRICPGREIGFNLMKIIAATVIQNYEVQILENQRVIPKIPFLKAIEDACEAILVGFVLAKSLWKLQRYWTGTAKERTQYTSSIEHTEG
ncbi:hypothetical protein Patl1_27773 [Pistacia atlantica]|uniref:Uncharacterized protein n=1 Tax=Pistacia atlantica TaxID=434234 RepID=A0ACC1BBY2_9ROSI|nr:hypothetical protein Patl1_27773 [Pistacia atlantica]